MNPPAKPALDTPSLAEAPSLSDEEGGLPVVDSAWILLGKPEVVIRHNGRHYRLRCTRLGKLILTA